MLNGTILEAANMKCLLCGSKMKQNIIEGAKAAVTSTETELKLTNVARASMEELLEDYRDFLRVRDLNLWDKNSEQALYVRYLSAGKITAPGGDGRYGSYEPDEAEPAGPSHRAHEAHISHDRLYLVVLIKSRVSPIRTAITNRTPMSLARLTFLSFSLGDASNICSRREEIRSRCLAAMGSSPFFL